MASFPSVGAYRVLAPIGASGAAFLVTERGAPRSVRRILKYVAGASGPRWRLRSRFLDLLSLDHPSFALPTHLGFDGRRAFLVRRYVDGAEILAAAAGKPSRRIAAWMLEAAEALEGLHAFGSAHGNLKPSNVLVPASRRTEAPQVVLTDPSWSAAEEDAGGSSAPAAEEFAADLVSLGRVFHRVLTGREAPSGEGTELVYLIK